MRTAKQYTEVTRINLRPEIEYCPCCQCYLRRTCTLSERTMVTLRKVLYLVHRGYRCPNDTCPGHARVYRSAAADAASPVWVHVWSGCAHPSRHPAFGKASDP